MHKPMPPGPGRFLFYLGYLSIELYYPYFFNTNRNWGISAGTKIICYKCNKRFNISTTPLISPTMKNFLKQFKVVDFLRTVRLYLKRVLSK